MTKDLEDNRDFLFGTHLPVNKAILKIFQPSGILELGAGKNSTPLFYNYGKQLISIESDIEWVELLRKQFVPKKDFELIWHDIGFGLQASTQRDEIPKEAADKCIAYYNNIIGKNPAINYLFIDHVSGLRMFTLKALFNKFDFICYHDAEDIGYFFYEIENCDLSNYLHYTFKSYEVHTGILIDKQYESKVSAFEKALAKFGKEYSKEFNCEYIHNFTQYASVGFCFKMRQKLKHLRKKWDMMAYVLQIT